LSSSGIKRGRRDLNPQPPDRQSDRQDTQGQVQLDVATSGLDSLYSSLYQISELAANTDANLARVVAAWADLPEAIQEAILVLVRASKSDE